jgi:hypothetical protein
MTSLDPRPAYPTHAMVGEDSAGLLDEAVRARARAAEGGSMRCPESRRLPTRSDRSGKSCILGEPLLWDMRKG